jgi:hypothetical protein
MTASATATKERSAITCGALGDKEMVSGPPVSQRVTCQRVTQSRSSRNRVCAHASHEESQSNVLIGESSIPGFIPESQRSISGRTEGMCSGAVPHPHSSSANRVVALSRARFVCVWPLDSPCGWQGEVGGVGVRVGVFSGVARDVMGAGCCAPCVVGSRDGGMDHAVALLLRSQANASRASGSGDLLDERWRVAQPQSSVPPASVPAPTSLSRQASPPLTSSQVCSEMQTLGEPWQRKPGSVAQDTEPPSPAAVLSSSQVSPASREPSPQRLSAEHWLGSPAQRKPDSTAQAEEQPLPAVVLASSHSSPPRITPSPPVGVQSALHVSDSPASSHASSSSSQTRTCLSRVLKDRPELTRRVNPAHAATAQRAANALTHPDPPPLARSLGAAHTSAPRRRRHRPRASPLSAESVAG